MKSQLISYISVCSILFILSSGCRKLVEVPPPKNQLSVTAVFDNKTSAAAYLTAIYADLNADYYFTRSLSTVTVYAGLASDELMLYDGASDAVMTRYFKNDLTSRTDADLWSNGYGLIFRANTAIEGLRASKGLQEKVKNQLLGEAYFLRAFFLFYLTNLYGDIPIPLTTDFKINSQLKRVNVKEVYQQIISDCQTAKSLLEDPYLRGDAATPSPERIRPNKAVATALLARSYLYANDFKNAETEATLVINDARYTLPALNDAFLSNSKEAIWQLQPVLEHTNTTAARFFIIPQTGFETATPVYLPETLVNSFDTNDQRAADWIGNRTIEGNKYYYPYKYKIDTASTSITEYTMVFRLAEQYLIRAEARAQNGDITGANSDLSVVRQRAGLNVTSYVNKDALLKAILDERNHELFTEWGHRWFDLKRTGKVNSVMTAFEVFKGGNWVETDQLFPIPLTEIQLDPQLVQNPGY